MKEKIIIVLVCLIVGLVGGFLLFSPGPKVNVSPETQIISGLIDKQIEKPKAEIKKEEIIQDKAKEKVVNIDKTLAVIEAALNSKKLELKELENQIKTYREKQPESTDTPGLKLFSKTKIETGNALNLSEDASKKKDEKIITLNESIASCRREVANYIKIETTLKTDVIGITEKLIKQKKKTVWFIAGGIVGGALLYHFLHR